MNNTLPGIFQDLRTLDLLAIPKPCLVTVHLDTNCESCGFLIIPCDKPAGHEGCHTHTFQDTGAVLMWGNPIVMDDYEIPKGF